MMRIIALSAALLFVPYAVNAAELPVPKLHKVHRTHHAAQAHFGYYFGQWGWRWGGTARSWYGSTFVFAGERGWEGASMVAASPKGVAAIVCPEWRPDACLAEPVLRPVAAIGRPGR